VRHVPARIVARLRGLPLYRRRGRRDDVSPRRSAHYTRARDAHTPHIHNAPALSLGSIG